MTGPIDPAGLALMDQVQALVTQMSSDLAEHWQECSTQPRRACIGSNVSEFLEGLDARHLLILLEEAISQLAEKKI